MTLSALIKKGGLREVATAIPATAATDDGKNTGTVARIATVAVANPQSHVTDFRLKPNETPRGLVPLDDPIVSPEHWYPSFREFHHNVVRESPDFDYGELREHNPNVYPRLKAKEDEIDALGAARLSQVMALLREWRELILTAEFERQQFTR